MSARAIHLSLSISLLLVGCGMGGRAREVTGLTALDGMLERRASHSAISLQDGRVLIAGGLQEDGRGGEQPIASAELFIPQSNRFERTESLHTARCGMVAALLQDGRVLLAGGWDSAAPSDIVEIYDPASSEFNRIGSMGAARSGTTATLLNDGSVLIVGGTSAGEQYIAKAERFIPKDNLFVPAGQLHHARSLHSATLLTDGSVLIAGGVGPSGLVSEFESFDPHKNEFTVVAAASSGRYKHAATALSDGRVLLAGGSDLSDWRGQLTTSLLFDPQTAGFADGPGLRGKRFKLSEAVARLNDGSVVVAGGSEWVEKLDAKTETFEVVGKLDAPYYYATATTLRDGRVLIAGGYNTDIRCTKKAWIYQP